MIPRSPSTCQGCPFIAGSARVHDYVPEEFKRTDRQARLLILAEAPAKDERAAGRPLAPEGTSGARFRAELQQSGLVAFPHCISNVVMCTNLEVAPKARGGLKTFNPPKAAYHACNNRWMTLAREIKPEVLLLLGTSVAEAAGLSLPGENLAAMRERINFGQPVFIEGARAILTRHPSGLTYKTRGGAEWQEFQSDFAMVREILGLIHLEAETL